MSTKENSPQTHFLDRPHLASLDRGGMLRLICDLPTQLKKSLSLRSVPALREGFSVSNILVCGLGGSAIGGGIASRLLRGQLNVPIQVSRGIEAPGFAGPQTLALVVSYSGCTTETLSTFQQLFQARSQLVVLTSGGQLAEQARLNRVPLITLPAGMPPRSAIGYSTVALVREIAAQGLCPDPSADIEAAAVALEALCRQLDFDCPYSLNRAKRIADALSGRVVSVFGSQGNLDAVARRWAGQLAENGKQVAFWSAVPEMLHNEIVGWNHPRSFLRLRTSVLLRDPADPPRLQLLFDDLDKHILAGQSHLTILATGRNRWERMFGLLLLGDFVSVYVALLHGEDPTPIQAITSHKARLQELDAPPPGSSAGLNE